MEIGSAGVGQNRTCWDLPLTLGRPSSRWGATPFVVRPLPFPCRALDSNANESPKQSYTTPHPFQLALHWQSEMAADSQLTKAGIAKREGLSRARGRGQALVRVIFSAWFSWFPLSAGGGHSLAHESVFVPRWSKFFCPIGENSCASCLLFFAFPLSRFCLRQLSRPFLQPVGKETVVSFGLEAVLRFKSEFVFHQFVGGFGNLNSPRFAS